ncbi:hypothetical protein O0I62_15805, partial [Stenotrophomonas sp. Sm3147]|nr:hypothetical protein [Stenotrophomonas sp. Sm3147]
MRTAALLLPLALAASFTSAPLLAAPATPAPAAASKSQLHLQTFHPGPQAMFSVGFYPEITDGCKRAENFWSCLATLRR